MAVESGAVLAGTGSPSLCWGAPVGTALPTDATTAFGAGWINFGLVTTDGLTVGVDEDTNDIDAFGVRQAVRRVTTKSSNSFQVTFLQSTPDVLALYHRKPFSGTGSIPAPDATGAFTFKTGAASVQRLLFAFDMVDGLNHIRCVTLEAAEVTERQEFQVGDGAAVQYGVTLTPYPDATGDALEWHYVVDAIKDTTP